MFPSPMMLLHSLFLKLSLNTWAPEILIPWLCKQLPGCQFPLLYPTLDFYLFPKVEPNRVLGFHLAGPMDQLKLIETVPPAIEKQCLGLLGTGSNASRSLSCSVHCPMLTLTPETIGLENGSTYLSPGVPLCPARTTQLLPSISLSFHPCLTRM